MRGRQECSYLCECGCQVSQKHISRAIIGHYENKKAIYRPWCPWHPLPAKGEALEKIITCPDCVAEGVEDPTFKKPYSSKKQLCDRHHADMKRSIKRNYIRKKNGINPANYRVEDRIIQNPFKVNPKANTYGCNRFDLCGSCILPEAPCRFMPGKMA